MKGRTLLIACAMLVLAAAGGTLAWATTGGNSTTIDACVAKNGKVSIYPAGQKCLASENPISWNVQGPAGPQGPPGTLPGDASAVGGTITITGQHFGDFGSGLKITGFTHEIVSPRDAASGLPTGKRQHKPFTITKELDKSSPLLLRSIYTNENLTSVLIGLLSPADGKAMATVKLTNASVSDDVQHGTTETISFTYQKITWTWVDGGITAEDDWEAPVS